MPEIEFVKKIALVACQYLLNIASLIMTTTKFSRPLNLAVLLVYCFSSVKYGMIAYGIFLTATVVTPACLTVADHLPASLFTAGTQGVVYVSCILLTPLTPTNHPPSTYFTFAKLKGWKFCLSVIRGTLCSTDKWTVEFFSNLLIWLEIKNTCLWCFSACIFVHIVVKAWVDVFVLYTK